jgi:nucleoside-diphosphate-sugar epimerase
VADAVAANLLAADAADAAGEVLNVAGGRRVSLNALLGELVAQTGARVEARYQPPRAGDVRDSLADLSRARALLGYEPSVGLARGLELTLAHLRATRER